MISLCLFAPRDILRSPEAGGGDLHKGALSCGLHHGERKCIRTSQNRDERPCDGEDNLQILLYLFLLRYLLLVTHLVLF